MEDCRTYPVWFVGTGTLTAVTCVPGEICRKLGIGQATFYLWKRQYVGLGVQELGHRQGFATLAQNAALYPVSRLPENLRYQNEALFENAHF